MTGSRSHKSYAATLWLALLGGAFGAHRFYAGKVGTGILYLFTFGFFFIGQFVDILTVAFGNFTDKSGHFIRRKEKEEMNESAESGKRKIPFWVWLVVAASSLALLGALFGGGDDTDAEEPQRAQDVESVEQTPSGEEPTDASSENNELSDVERVLLSDAFCNDLADGISLFQLYEGGLSSGAYETGEEFADLAYGYAWMSCPEQLEENGDLRSYLESWGIDPDTGGLFRAEVEEELGYTQEQLTACFTQWERDQAAVQSGSDDETALRATAYDCPNYDAWSLGFNLYSSGNEATMIQALCAFEANSPVCRDAESRGIL